jgi:hypothetical protein
MRMHRLAHLLYICLPTPRTSHLIPSSLTHKFLCTASGVVPPTWESFLTQTGRDVGVEKSLHEQREAHRARFAAEWGGERHLLHAQSHEAVLEMYPVR